MKDPILTCPICGKKYKARLTRGKRQKTCSKECGYKNLYPQGTLKYFATKNNMNEKQFIELIDKEHNINKLPIKVIAEKYGIVRITLMRWCKKYGIKTRSISEDNNRRYSTMTEEQKKMQTEKAHEGIRELFKDPKWKEKQIKKVLSAQENIVSYPEKLFEKMIKEKGYNPISQYGEGLAGFILDFAFPEIKLAVEIDGEYWHSLEKTKIKDRRRAYFLEVKKGWKVLHIPAKAFTKNPEPYLKEVIQEINKIA